MLSQTDTANLIIQVAEKTQRRHPSCPSAVKARLSLPAGHSEEKNITHQPVILKDTDADSTDEVASHTRLIAPRRYMLSPINQLEHFWRINAVLTYSDRHGGWIGLKNFINLYFSTVFHSFFGDQIDMQLIHIEKRKKFCAHFSLRPPRAYRIIIMLNYRLWDTMLLSASALPDAYFRLPDRSYLEKAAMLSTPSQTFHFGHTKEADNRSSEDNDNATTTATWQASDKGQWYAVSLSALCLIHRLEMIMFDGLRDNHANHVVTLGKFFANNNDSNNPFILGYVYD